MSDAEIVRALGLRFRQYRLRMALTQRDVSQRTGLSLATIHKFETECRQYLADSTSCTDEMQPICSKPSKIYSRPCLRRLISTCGAASSNNV